MQRKDFIKKITGNDPKSLLFWTVALFALFILLKTDFSQLGNSIDGTLQLIAIFFAVLVIVILVSFVLKWAIKKTMTILPVRLISWVKQNGTVILNIITIALFIYLLYYAYTKEKYSSIIFMLVSAGILFFFRKKPGTNKS